MRNLFMALAMLLLPSVAFGGKSEYEVNQQFGDVIVKLSIPGADEVMAEKSGGKLISKELRVVGFIWGKEGFRYSMTFDTIIERNGEKMRFRETSLIGKKEVVSTTELLERAGRIDKYLLVTKIKKVGKKTLISHELKMAVDGAETGFRVVIAGRIALSHVESGIRHVLGEPRPEKEDE